MSQPQFPHVIYGNRKIFEGKPDVVLTIGNFDGVHLGHQALIHTLKERGLQKNLPCVALTFYPHPTHILTPEKPKALLVRLEERVQTLLKHGCDAVIVYEFNEKFLSLEPQVFLNEVILNHMKPHEVHVGQEFRFGHKQKGNAATIREFCAANHIHFYPVAEEKIGSQKISSSLVRSFLTQGECESSAALLGRNFKYSGIVSHGEKIGRTLGFPTANIIPDKELLCPGTGVYACWAYLENGKNYAAAVNVGVRPTIGSGLRTLIEAYILDFSENIYDQKVDIEFVSKIREEEKFDSLESLKKQIIIDVENVKKLLRAG